MKKKIVCVADGGTTPELMGKMKALETLYDAEVVIIEDHEMSAMGPITERMLLIEQYGINAAPTLKALKAVCRDAHVIVVHVASVNREIIDHCEKLEVVIVLRGGIENADIDYLTKKNIKLVNAPWRSANAVADFTVGLMIAENKNIARSHRMLFDGKWCKNYVNQNYIRDLRTCRVGLIGFGYIGSRVAERLKGFGCEITAHDPYLNPSVIEAAGVKPVELEALLKSSDFVTIHLRLSEETKYFMDARKFNKMKKTAYFINTARSGLVCTEDLINALKRRTIGGAAIDVFDSEPLPAEHPYLSLDNITLTAHLAGTSCDTMGTSVEIGYEEAERYLKGEEMCGICN